MGYIKLSIIYDDILEEEVLNDFKDLSSAEQLMIKDSLEVVRTTLLKSILDIIQPKNSTWSEELIFLTDTPQKSRKSTGMLIQADIHQAPSSIDYLISAQDGTYDEWPNTLLDSKTKPGGCWLLLFISKHYLQY